MTIPRLDEIAWQERELEHWAGEFKALMARAKGVDDPLLDDHVESLEAAFERLRYRLRELKRLEDSPEAGVEDELGDVQAALEDFASYVVRAGR